MNHGILALVPFSLGRTGTFEPMHGRLRVSILDQVPSAFGGSGTVLAYDV